MFLFLLHKKKKKNLPSYLSCSLLKLSLDSIQAAEESTDTEARTKVRLVVPNSSCGGIIGKGGATIK